MCVVLFRLQREVAWQYSGWFGQGSVRLPPVLYMRLQGILCNDPTVILHKALCPSALLHVASAISALLSRLECKVLSDWAVQMLKLHLLLSPASQLLLSASMLVAILACERAHQPFLSGI